MIFKFFLSAFAIFNLVLFGTPTLGWATEVTEGTCQKIIVSGPPIWPPHVLYNQKTKTRSGPAFDLVTQAFDELGVDVEFQSPKPWKRVLRELEQGDIDLTVAVLDDKKRREVFLYTSNWTNDVYGAVTRKNSKINYETVESLKGRLGGYYAGIKLPPPLNQILTEGYKVAAIDEILNLYRVLKEKRVDYLVVSVSAFFELMPIEFQTEGFTAIDKSAVSLPVHMAFSRKSPCVKYLKELNVVLDAYRIANKEKQYSLN